MRSDNVAGLLDRYGEATRYFELWRDRAARLGVPASGSPTITLSGGLVYPAADLHRGVVIVDDHFAHLTIERGQQSFGDEFSRFDDAAKLLLKSEGQKVRSYLKLPRKYLDWRAMGVHPAVSVEEEMYAAVLTLRDDPSVWCKVPVSEQAATSQIMMMSMAELDAQLIEGIER
ncbi:hypothetical protein [Rhodococcus sp. NPDC058481]|uniref:hypothetical protein n=1 Tax=unclassified Rhodococcus (in: high G+C Gram-positive bacteria) TaxID=192944 RepID=UPI003652DF95